jgi:hypothetical protein
VVPARLDYAQAPGDELIEWQVGMNVRFEQRNRRTFNARFGPPPAEQRGCGKNNSHRSPMLHCSTCLIALSYSADVQGLGENR